MTFEAFRASLREGQPPEELEAALCALWWCEKGDWDLAHQLAQDAGSPAGDWVHAHLHRVEGDVANAGYWYARAGRTPSRAPLPEEWEEIVTALLNA
jgi:hypothetical protein